MKNIKFYILPILFSFAFTGVAPADESSGDKKIEDTKERVEEDVEDEEGHHRHKEHPEMPADADYGSAIAGIFEAIFNVFKVWGEYSFGARYAAYPYATTLYHYNTSQDDFPGAVKIYSIELSSEGNWHVGNTYGLNSKLSFRFSALNFNLFDQFVFAGHEWFNALSANGGVSFLAPNFSLDLFIGAFGLDFLDRVFLSFGAQVLLFFRPHLYFELYNLNSIYGGLEFFYISGCLSYALGRWGIGAGFNYSNFNGFSYLGPLIKVSLWF